LSNQAQQAGVTAGLGISRGYDYHFGKSE
jgi:hypothetical protein